MIAFDNGPADGDYVRYIDDLMKRAAVAASAGVLAAPETGGSTIARTIDRLVAPRPPSAGASGRPADRGTTGVAVTPWRPLGRDGLRPALPDAARTTGFAASSTASPAAVSAAAIASALMSGQMTGKRAWATRTTAGLAALALGLVLLVIGFLTQPLNVLVIAGGGALVAWAIRWILDASKRQSGGTSGTTGGTARSE